MTHLKKLIKEQSMDMKMNECICMIECKFADITNELLELSNLYWKRMQWCKNNTLIVSCMLFFLNIQGKNKVFGELSLTLWLYILLGNYLEAVCHFLLPITPLPHTHPFGLHTLVYNPGISWCLSSKN